MEGEELGLGRGGSLICKGLSVFSTPVSPQTTLIPHIPDHCTKEELTSYAIHSDLALQR